MHDSGRPSDLRIALAVAGGGVLGSLGRWALAVAIPWHSPSLPVATLAVNLVGCLLIGMLLTWWTEGVPPAWWVRPFAVVGFIGGFTTFSAFAFENVRLTDAGAGGIAALYIATSLVAGLVLVHVGSYGARWALGGSRGEPR